jgi:hypothetical protein
VDFHFISFWSISNSDWIRFLFVLYIILYIACVIIRTSRTCCPGEDSPQMPDDFVPVSKCILILVIAINNN